MNDATCHTLFISICLYMFLKTVGSSVVIATLEDLLGSDTFNPNIAFQALKATQTFLQKSCQLRRI